jgi:hypothetical protein
MHNALKQQSCIISKRADAYIACVSERASERGTYAGVQDTAAADASDRTYNTHAQQFHSSDVRPVMHAGVVCVVDDDDLPAGSIVQRCTIVIQK